MSESTTPFTGTNADCVECPAGKYTSETGRDDCLNCPEGKFQAAGGATGCVDCIAGQFAVEDANNWAGAETCTDCMSFSGRFGFKEASQCDLEWGYLVVNCFLLVLFYLCLCMCRSGQRREPRRPAYESWLRNAEEGQNRGAEDASQSGSNGVPLSPESRAQALREAFALSSVEMYEREVQADRIRGLSTARGNPMCISGVNNLSSSHEIVTELPRGDPKDRSVPVARAVVLDKPNGTNPEARIVSPGHATLLRAIANAETQQLAARKRGAPKAELDELDTRINRLRTRAEDAVKAEEENASLGAGKILKF